MTNEELLAGVRRLRKEANSEELRAVGQALMNAEAYGWGRQGPTMERAQTERALSNALERMDNRLLKQRR